MASTMNASANPFAPPSGESIPVSATAGSVVGSPAASSAHPSGSCSPRAAYAAILPRATALIARSTTMGPDVPGNPAASGDVDSRRWSPPQGGSTAGPVENTSEAMPSAAASAL